MTLRWETMTTPPDPDRGDAELHELFADLRSQVVNVVNTFSHRVMERVEATEQADRPAWGGALGQIIVETLNLLAVLVAGPGDAKRGDDDGS